MFRCTGRSMRITTDRNNYKHAVHSYKWYATVLSSFTQQRVKKMHMFAEMCRIGQI